MKKVEEKAYAKINLVLNIGDLRPDGYHDIQTIMQSLELHDDVTVEQTGGTGITVTASVDTIPTDESNLAVKAVKAFAAKTGVPADGLSIHIEKRIPVAAGLGGGSSDAAATLRALNVLYETNLSVDELAEIGIEVLPEGTYLCMSRWGMPYEPEGIRAIVACMDEHALQPVGNAFDFCYLDTTSYDESHQEDFCCIQIPVTLQM